ncbi:uncharacterized protein BX664DRAFT_362846 [Halteromyces radiatus]|uniref:uncharacterized protein n=1 Tax=Halteromyces radiatus TaxID=101107 RepID=UPI00221FA15C|nr:uncharacterized protein BX664DRAFT_362846 [Halteromyces radiatus]KAI8076315.1 hypothetical protein BX664DRAFT_362846 [Halteromyces radiatus]
MSGDQRQKIKPVRCLTTVKRLNVELVHVFQTIWSVFGSTGQYHAKGGIINVPASVNRIVTAIPRPLQDTSIYHVRLARKMSFARSYVEGNIRPAVVHEAARILSETDLYRDHGVQSVTGRDYDDQPINPDGSETLITGDEGIRFAPVEGHTPLSIATDVDSEYLAFPSIFGGARLQPTTNVSYADMTKSIIRRYDRRATRRHDYILFADRKLQIQKLPDAPLNDYKSISESELWSTYFDPILSCLVSDPERLTHLRWTNTIPNEKGKSRPDAIISEKPQLDFLGSVGYGEAKIYQGNGNKHALCMDTLRLVVFNNVVSIR